MSGADEDAVKELDEMKKRLKEIEEEAGALPEMQAKVEKEMGVVQGLLDRERGSKPGSGGAASAQIEAIDRRERLQTCKRSVFHATKIRLC